MVRNPQAPKRLALDTAGIALLAAGLGSLQFVLDEGERRDWYSDGSIVLFTFAFVAGLTAFVLWELYGTKRPIIDLRVFRYRNVTVGAATSIVLGAVLFGPVVLLPQYTQNVLGFTSTESGLLMLVRALPVVLLTPFVARSASRMDARYLIGGGCLISAVSFALLGLHMTTQSDFRSLMWFVGLSGIGQSMVFVPLLVSVLSSVDSPADAPKASSFISLAFQLGGSVASTMLVTIFDRRTYFHADVMRGSANVHNPLFEHVSYSTRSIALLARLVQQQAVNAGFADAIWALVLLSLLAVAFAMLLQRQSKATR